MRGYARLLLLLMLPVAWGQQPLSPATGDNSPFLSVTPAVSDELRFGAQLPEFEAKDIGGRTWRLEDLHGKFTLISIWHTFEARAADRLNPHGRGTIAGLPDLPELQRFYDNVRNSKNIQVLTFCRDYDYTHARDYMKEKSYTFPVVADWALVNKLFKPSEGQERLVNPDGQLSYPFRSWSFGRLLFEVEKTAAHN
jgi:hypothetical protein